MSNITRRVSTATEGDMYIVRTELSDFRGRVYERTCHTTWSRTAHIKTHNKYLAQGYAS